VASVREEMGGDAVFREIRGNSYRIVRRRDIPDLPLVAVKALGMLGHPDLNLRLLAGVLAEDGLLAARILAICHSAYYRQRTLTTTLQAALQVIGLRDLRNIIFSAVTRSLFNTYGPVADALWCHSLAVALAGRMLSRRLPQVDPEQAFLAGVLHDVGQIIFMRDNAETYSRISSDARQNKTLLVEAEQAHYGVSHEQVGVILIERWNLDSEIATAVATHHDHQESTHVNSLAAVLAAADYLTLKAGLGFFAPAPGPSPEILRTFGFDDEEHLTHATLTLRHSFDTEGALLNARYNAPVSHMR
jgi:putative nucleotidyltransferase with HDIG domain